MKDNPSNGNPTPKRIATILILLLIAGGAMAQTWFGNNDSQKTRESELEFSINVCGPDALANPIPFQVCLLPQENMEAIRSIQLSNPAGQSIQLIGPSGLFAREINSLTFSTTALPAESMGPNPKLKPLEPFDLLSNSPSGVWHLRVELASATATFDLLNWSITFGDGAQLSVNLTESNLPIILLDTEGVPIPDDPKIPAQMKIIDNGPGALNHPGDNPAYVGLIGIEVRGSSSQSFPKKSYGVETWDASHASLDTTLLGMPSENDWILNANYTDKTFCRNAISYQIWQNMGHYATRYKFVEVMLNNVYQGIYIFSEKIKRDKNRVNIAKLNPDENSGDALTGGYIFKIDKTTGSGGAGWTSGFPPPVHPNNQTIFFQYDYPEYDEITSAQKSFIQGYVNEFETALAGPSFADTLVGFRKYAVEPTFFDYFLVNELSRNVDGYRLSTFIHKERNTRGDKLRMGPVWDYDIAWHNANYCDGQNSFGWAYQFPCPDDTWQIPFWWSRLLEDPLYAARLNCRYYFLRGNILSNQWFDQYIDSVANLLADAQVRNFTTWPILGQYVWPNPYPIPTTYQGEINALKNWVHSRLNWLDMNMPGVCNTTFSIGASLENTHLMVWPVPATESLLYASNCPCETCDLEIRDMLGKVWFSRTQVLLRHQGEPASLDISSLPPGVYLLQLKTRSASTSARFIKK